MSKDELIVIRRVISSLYGQIDDLLEQLGQYPPEGLHIEDPFDPWLTIP